MFGLADLSEVADLLAEVLEAADQLVEYLASCPEWALRRAEQADWRADTQRSAAPCKPSRTLAASWSGSAPTPNANETPPPGVRGQDRRAGRDRADLRARGARAESEADTERRERARLSARLEELLATHAPNTTPSDDTTTVSSGLGPAPAEPGAAKQPPQ
jgi:hypothetical protein